MLKKISFVAAGLAVAGLSLTISPDPGTTALTPGGFSELFGEVAPSGFISQPGGDVDPPAVPPAAPQNLMAFGYEDQVQLYWDDNTEPDFYVYRIYRGPDAGSLVWYASPAPGQPSEYDDNVVVNGTTYFYAVSAINDGALESELSNIVSATPDLPALVFNSFVITGGFE